MNALLLLAALSAPADDELLSLVAQLEAKPVKKLCACGPNCPCTAGQCDDSSCPAAVKTSAKPRPTKPKPSADDPDNPWQWSADEGGFWWRWKAAPPFVPTGPCKCGPDCNAGGGPCWAGEGCGDPNCSQAIRPLRVPEKGAVGACANGSCGQMSSASDVTSGGAFYSTGGGRRGGGRGCRGRGCRR